MVKAEKVEDTSGHGVLGRHKNLLNRKDSSSIKQDRTQSSFTTHSQLVVCRKLLGWKLENSKTRKKMRHLHLRQRFPSKLIGWKNWIQKLLEVVKTPNKSNQHQKLKISRTVRPVGEQPAGSFTQEMGKDVLFGCESTNSRTERSLNASSFSQSCVPVSVERVDKDKDADENADADQTRTGRPVGSEQSIDFFTQRERHWLQSGSWVRQKVRKSSASRSTSSRLITSTNTFSDDAKAMIREMGNVEFFEIFETIPKVQCSQCILYWNQGVNYCTCGNLLVESESSPKRNQLRLDALSIPHYVTKKGRPHGFRHGKTLAQKEHFIAHNARKRCLTRNYEGIHDRFLRDQVCRDSQLKIGWTEQKCIEMNKLAQEDHSYRPSREKFKRYQGQWYLTLNKSGKNAPMRLRSDFRAAVTNQKPSPPRIRRRTCGTHSFSTVPKMAPFFLKFFVVELGHVQKLVELMSSIHFCKCLSQSVSYTADSNLLQPTGGVDSTPHTSLFLMQWTRTHCCTSHCMAQVLVHASSHPHSHPCHALEWLFVLSFFLKLFSSVCFSYLFFFCLNLDLYLFLFHVDFIGAISHWHAKWGVWPFGKKLTSHRISQSWLPQEYTVWHRTSTRPWGFERGAGRFPQTHRGTDHGYKRNVGWYW